MRIEWSTKDVALVIDDEETEWAAIRYVGPPDRSAAWPAPVPLVDLRIVGEGSTSPSRRYVDSTAGKQLRYTEHHSTATSLQITLRSEHGLVVHIRYHALFGLPILRVLTTVENRGTTDVLLQSVSSVSIGGVLKADVSDIRVHWSRNEWLSEFDWKSAMYREVASPNPNLVLHKADGLGRFSTTAVGTQSTSDYLPIGAIESSRGAIVWEIEHNGPWHWEVGERRDGVYLTALGPTDVEHQFLRVLPRGETFAAVPARLWAGHGSALVGLADLVEARRRSRAAVSGPISSRVIYSDYANTLMADPNEQDCVALLESAAAVGCETYCIDAGWYSDGQWWQTGGDWFASQNRFPAGLEAVTDEAHRVGMGVGLWFEPEVVGSGSSAAVDLPDSAFFQRQGSRVTEAQRHMLDLRDATASTHLRSRIDEAIDKYGLKMLKFDFNMDAGVGTDSMASSAGSGLLDANRSYVQWIDELRRDHPEVGIENCSSGGMRCDSVLMERSELQATSDQQDFRLLPRISCNAATLIPAEQCESWAYPSPDMSLNDIHLTMTGAVLSVPYVSGFLRDLPTPSFQSVKESIDAHKSIRTMLASSRPFWPLGLAHGDDEWIALGRRSNIDRSDVLAIWHLGQDAGVQVVPWSLPKDAQVEVLYPRDSALKVTRVPNAVNVQADERDSIILLARW